MKNNYIHNENHTQILQKDLQDKEQKLREQHESSFKSRENKLIKIIMYLKSKIETEFVT